MLRSLADNKPGEKSYDDLKNLLTEHLNPKPNIIAECYKFYKRDRKPEETVSEYLAELMKLSGHCGFGTNISDFIRDRLVCGISDERILQKLLAEKELTLTKAESLAFAMEAALKNSKEIQGSDVPLHRMANAKGKRKCFRCCSVEHMADVCPHKSKKCFHCKKIGHLKQAY